MRSDKSLPAYEMSRSGGACMRFYPKAPRVGRRGKDSTKGKTTQRKRWPGLAELAPGLVGTSHHWHDTGQANTQALAQSKDLDCFPNLGCVHTDPTPSLRPYPPGPLPQGLALKPLSCCASLKASLHSQKSG